MSVIKNNRNTSRFEFKYDYTSQYKQVANTILNH